MTVIEYQGGSLELMSRWASYQKVTYKVKLISGEWPEENDLYCLVDNGENDLTRRHFGGHFEVMNEQDNLRSVIIWVD